MTERFDNNKCRGKVIRIRKNEVQNKVSDKSSVSSNKVPCQPIQQPKATLESLLELATHFNNNRY